MGGPKKPIAPSRSSSKRWQEESEALRAILHGCGLDEAIKWGKPCYGFDGNNVAIIQKMKAYLALMFFKGSLLKDSRGVLHRPGQNSHIARRFQFASLEDIVESRAVIERYVREAIEIEKAGLKVTKPNRKLVFPEELLAKFEREPAFKTAFESLTPGRQRGYNLYFAAPKGTEARQRRIDKYAPKILDGKGLQDR